MSQVSSGYGNVTFNPLAPAIPVKNPAIKEILNFDSGEFIETEDYISGKRYEKLIIARLAIRDRLSERPVFGCALCATPVYLVSNQQKHFFFRHIAEDGSCPAQTRGALSQEEIRAHKYHGLRESEAHRKIKDLIKRSLEADPEFSNVGSEKQWRSSRDPKSRRQPDVQAISPNGRIAFEVQLSTTFLDVVAGRRAFYRDEGALLIWAMGSFDPTYRRLTTDDLLFSNNSNIFVVSEETTQLSETTGKFHLCCHYRVPAQDGTKLIDSWDTRIVRFDELTCELKNQRAWYFDYEGKATTIRTEIEHQAQERKRKNEDALRERFLSFWKERDPHLNPDTSGQIIWEELSNEFERFEITLPASPDEDSSFSALLNGVLSAKVGEPVGWHFKQLVEVAHRIADGYPQHVAAFGFAVKQFEREELLQKQDKSGKWSHRREKLRNALKARQANYLPDLNSIPLLIFLFPEIGTKIKKLAENR